LTYFDETKPKGYDRPWIQASDQPLMAPRSQELSGDPFGMLLKQRIIFMGGEVEDFMADAIVSQLLLLDAQDPTKDIKIFINSPGQRLPSCGCCRTQRIRMGPTSRLRRCRWLHCCHCSALPLSLFHRRALSAL
jgi:hypothetical protein